MRAAGFAIHSHPPRLGLSLALGAVMGWLGAIACKRAEPEPEPEPALAERLTERPEKMEVAWAEADIPGVPAATPVMIKQGPAPLVYLSEAAATLRVVDRAGDQVLAEGAVGPRTIVVVDTQRGIVFGGRTLMAGPLAGRRRYAIYLVPRGDNVSRMGVSRPVKRPEPETDVDVTAPEPAAEPTE